MGEIDGGLSLLDEAMATARKAGRLDEMMRCYANRTTLLDLDSRREEALDVVKRGHAPTRPAAGSHDLRRVPARQRRRHPVPAGSLGRVGSGVPRGTGVPAGRPRLVQPDACTWAWCWSSPARTRRRRRLVGQTLLQLRHVPAGQWSALRASGRRESRAVARRANDARRAAATWLAARGGHR